MLSKSIHRVASLLICIFMMGFPAGAEDWPCWRGPDHNGVSVETDWFTPGISTPEVVWTQDIGTGYSTMTIAQGRLFAMGNIRTKNSYGQMRDHDAVYCLDPNTGDVIWTFAYLESLDARNYDGGTNATPTVADANVYTLSRQGVAYCLDVIDGHVHWKADLKKRHGLTVPKWGFASSAYVEQDRVYFNAGTRGLALSAIDGSTIWSTGSSRSGYATPVVYDVDGHHLLIMMGSSSFAAVDANDGTVMWTKSKSSGSAEHITDPIVDGNNLLVSTGYSKGTGYYEMSATSVRQLWYQKDLQTFLNTAVLDNGYIYAANDKGSDSLTCMDSWDNGRILWTQPGDYRYGSVMMADGKLIVLEDNGYLSIVEVNPDRYVRLGRWRILKGGDCWTVPVLANGKIYARNSLGTLVCVSLKNSGGRSSR